MTFKAFESLFKKFSGVSLATQPKAESRRGPEQTRGPSAAAGGVALCVKELSPVLPSTQAILFRPPRPPQPPAKASFCTTGRDKSLKEVISDAVGSDFAKPRMCTLSCRRFQSPSLPPGLSGWLVSRCRRPCTHPAVGLSASGATGRGSSAFHPQHPAFHLHASGESLHDVQLPTTKLKPFSSSKRKINSI